MPTQRQECRGIASIQRCGSIYPPAPVSRRSWRDGIHWRQYFTRCTPLRVGAVQHIRAELVSPAEGIPQPKWRTYRVAVFQLHTARPHQVKMESILTDDHRALLAWFARANVLLAFDYDGTLSPIASTPESAKMRRSTRVLLARAARVYPCVIISGRALDDLTRRLRHIPAWYRRRRAAGGARARRRRRRQPAAARRRAQGNRPSASLSLVCLRHRDLRRRRCDGRGCVHVELPREVAHDSRRAVESRARYYLERQEDIDALLAILVDMRAVKSIAIREPGPSSRPTC